MTQQLFKSKYPILEAAMNKGSTIELALAVHEAGGYPSLCSWTYNIGQGFEIDRMYRDLDTFVTKTGSNNIHISFELDELESVDECHKLVSKYKMPTVEVIYGYTNSPRPLELMSTEQDIVALTKPLHDMGVKVFRRIYDPVTQETMNAHYLDGFCLKGKEAGGFTSTSTLKDFFLTQQQLTPTAMLIPYGGIGTADQVKEYLDLGATMVGVGTVLALSQESTIKLKAKQAALLAKSSHLKDFGKTFDLDDQKTVTRKQNALQFQEYRQLDDFNRTRGLVAGMWDQDTKEGHIYFGQSIDHVTEILPCKQIIEQLVSKI